MLPEKIIKTTIHGYQFDLTDAAQALVYAELHCRLKDEAGRAPLSTYNVAVNGRPQRSVYLPSEPIDIETKFIFDNQWNATDVHGTGVRIFDWREYTYPNAKVIQGYYLALTSEMIELRQQVKQCCYCGNLVHTDDLDPAKQGFCFKCLSSDNLQKEDLKRLRLIPVKEKWKGKTKELTKEESAFIYPAYEAAQKERQARTAVQKRKEIQKEYDTTVRNAVTKRKGFLAMLDAGIGIDNCIYYSHTNTFSFGWRTPMGDSEAHEILGKLRDLGFPYKAEAKTKGGTFSLNTTKP